MANGDTKKSILDAAEGLFATNGYHNTSLRAITGKAEVNLAAVNYHFGSKEALLVAVIERRLEPLNRLRIKRLEEAMATARAQTRRPAPREILQAFIEPTLAFRSSGPGARSFVVLISRALGDPDPTVRAVFLDYIRPVFTLFSECLGASLPHISPEVLFWRTHFMMGSLAHIMHGLDKKELFPAEMVPENPLQIMDMLLNFLSAGMEASP